MATPTVSNPAPAQKAPTTHADLIAINESNTALIEEILARIADEGRDLAGLAAMATELAMRLGSDEAVEPDIQQRHARDIRDGLLRRVRAA